MKRNTWGRSILVFVLAAVLLLGAGLAAGARADGDGGSTYTDAQGRKFRVVPLGDGRYELWMLAEEIKEDGEWTADTECKHKNAVWRQGNDSFHWQYCPDCGKLFEPLPHAYDRVTVKKAATCTADAVLERSCVCGRVDTGNTAPAAGDAAEYFAHHVPGDTYESDGWDHWKTCGVCGVKLEEGRHTVTNLTVEKEPTCIEPGTAGFDCGVCGRHLTGVEASLSNVERYPELAALRPLGHDFSGPLVVATGLKKADAREKGTHAASCVRCGTADLEHKEAHVWAEYTIRSGKCNDPDDPVVIGGTCACGATLELSYPREHVLVEDKTRDIPPTCTEPGKINGHRCMICGEFMEYDFAEALGHDFVEDKEKRKEPTCENTGTSYWFCSREGCEETQEKEIPALSKIKMHNWVRKDGKAAECGGTGWFYYECKICHTVDEERGTIFEKDVPHDTYTVTKSAGSEFQTSTRDGVPVTGKHYRTTIKCRRCGKTLGTEEFTVWKSMKNNRYLVEEGKRKTLDSLKGATVVKQQAGKDTSYFETQVMKGVSEYIQKQLPKYDYADGE